MVARAQAGSIGVRAISCSARRQREVVTLLPACALAVRASSVARHRADVATRSVALIRFVAVVAARLVVAAAARMVVVPPLVARSLEARSISVDSVNA